MPSSAAAATSPQRPSREQWVLFRADDQLVGLPIGTIREVLPPRPFAPLPGSRPYVCGLANVRGRIVTVVDLAARMGLPPAAARPDHHVVVVEHEGRLVGLAVSEIVRAVEIDPEASDFPSAEARGDSIERGYRRAPGEGDGHLFLAMDPGAIFRPLLA